MGMKGGSMGMKEGRMGMKGSCPLADKQTLGKQAWWRACVTGHQESRGCVCQEAAGGRRGVLRADPRTCPRRQGGSQRGHVLVERQRIGRKEDQLLREQNASAQAGRQRSSCAPGYHLEAFEREKENQA